MPEVPYSLLKQTHWQEWGFASPEETYYQREQREAAESKCRGIDRQIKNGKLSSENAVAIVRELLRTSRSPSKRPVFEAWLAGQEE